MAMRPRFTNAGQDLQTRALGGTQILFTKMQLGDGVLGTTDYKTLTELISPKATLALAGIKIDDGAAIIKGYFNNESMTEGFNYRELGLFARDPDDPSSEILYCYANFGDEYQYIAEPSSQLIERTVRIAAIVDDAPNVSAIISTSAQYVDEERLTEVINMHNNDLGAHPTLMSFSVEFYIDNKSEEDDSVRDGSMEHPFISFDEAIGAIPTATQRVKLIVLGSYIPYEEDSIVLNNYESVEIVGVRNDHAVTIGAPMIFCDDCLVQLIDFNISGAVLTDEGEGVSILMKNSFALINGVTGFDYADEYGFIKFVNSDATMIGYAAVSALVAVEATYGSSVHIASGVANGGTTAYKASYGSKIHLAFNAIEYTTATQPTATDHGGLILNSMASGDISDGSMSAHLRSTDNPHHVSLTQAQNYGGTVNVPHGGTGKTTFDSGALLKGNGAGALAQLLGTGALYAAVTGSPQFGTLPISAGGTGQTDIKKAYKTPINGAHYGYYILPGSDNLMLAWGRVSMDAGSSFTWGFEGYFDNHLMTDSNYVLVFSNDDIETSHVNKYADRFEISSYAVGSRVADFVMIGKAAN